MADTKDLVVQRGKTFSTVLRWEAEPVIYRRITGMQRSAPVRLNVTEHGMPDGWRGVITNVKGMTELNAHPNSLESTDYRSFTVIDADTLEINEINAAGFKAYISGGILQYNTPVDLVGYTARMSIKEVIDGMVLHSLTTENSCILINAAARTITLTIGATDTALFDWDKGVYDLELVSATGVVTALLAGKVTVSKEVTT